MLDTDERSIALLPSPYTMFKLQHKTLLSMLLVPLFINSLIPQYLYFYRRGFRLPQRSHLRTLKNFVSEKSGKRCEKSGKHEIKLGNREILRRLIFFFLYPRLFYHLIINLSIIFPITQATSCLVTDGTWNTVLVDKSVDDYTLSLNPTKGYGQSSIHTSRVSEIC